MTYLIYAIYRLTGVLSRVADAVQWRVSRLAGWAEDRMAERRADLLRDHGYRIVTNEDRVIGDYDGNHEWRYLDAATREPVTEWGEDVPDAAWVARRWVFEDFQHDDVWRARPGRALAALEGEEIRS